MKQIYDNPFSVVKGPNYTIFSKDKQYNKTYYFRTNVLNPTIRDIWFQCLQLGELLQQFPWTKNKL